MEPNTLNIFLAVVFITAPTVFRIVRGLTLDIRTRDYVAAAQTRGEGPWYIDDLGDPAERARAADRRCLPPDRLHHDPARAPSASSGSGSARSCPDWGSTINEGRKLLRVYVHPALPPALAIMSLVLGLNLLADALREQAMKD